MATEILVNDGGAPARILPFTAGGTVSAGDALQMDTNTEKVVAPATSGAKILGVALTAATSGNLVNAITGRGPIVRCNVTGTLAAGNMLDAMTNGKLQIAAGTGQHAVAIALEDGSGASTIKVMLV